MAKAHGMTFVPFYSTEMENLSEKGTKMVWPQHEMQILIENGNEVVRPAKDFTHKIFIKKGNTVVCHQKRKVVAKIIAIFQ